jgi:YYY domain-containing protein
MVTDLGLMTADAPVRPRPAISGNIIVALLLSVIILIGGYFRFVGLNWDDYTYLHPDERFLMQVASGLGGAHSLTYTNPADLTPDQIAQRDRCLARYPDTNGVGTYFDAECSTYNPFNIGFSTFVYGTLPTFTHRAMAELFVNVTGDPSWTQFYQIQLPSRLVSAIAEMLVIVVVFCAGLRAHDKWIGLLAAALYSFTAFSIQQAHFGTSDPMANLFSALSILFAICVQRDGKLRDYALFGVAFGCALASRINLLPLVGLIFVAAALRVMPAFARGVGRMDRDEVLTQHGVGLLMAGLTTLVVFRLLNPYAFMGPGVFGILPNERWLDEVGKARYFVSGDWDAPPNWQWVARPRYLFALWNMVAWGMGIAFGVAAWASAAVGLWRLIRGRSGALANAIPLAWIVAYFALIGGQWVMTMRYYLPLYPALAVLAAWGLVSLVRRTQYRRVLGSQFSVQGSGSQSDDALRTPHSELRTQNSEHSTENRELRTENRIRRIFGTVALIGVLTFTLLWGLGFTNVYRNLTNRVAASVWFWEQVPGDFAMRIDDAPADTPLINIALANNGFPGNDYNLEGQATQFAFAGASFTYDFTAPATGSVSSIYAPHLGDLTSTPEEETLRFRVLRTGDGATLATAQLRADLPRDDHPLGNAYTIPLDAPLMVNEGESYRFEVTLDVGMSVVSGGSVVVWEGDWDDPLPVKTCTPTDGLTLADDPASGRFTAADCNGRDAYWALLGGGYKLQLVNNDTPANRELMLQRLNDADYVIISSNRFYDSMTRNPARWPMTTRYYEALFSGELGFDVAATFNRAFGIGDFAIPDNYLPTFGAPAWLNELEAEEAFHVYDHPAVLIFRQADDYSPQMARAILESVPMQQSIAARPLSNCPENPESYYCDPTLIDQDVITSAQASRTPTYLQLTSDERALQDAGATWATRFDSGSPINTQQGFTVIVWWLAMLAFGGAAFPLLFCLFPALGDRGYGLAKIAGLLLVAWSTWYVASLRAPVWTGGGIAVALAALALLSLVVVWRRRREFGAFVIGRWRLLAGIEAITLLCFVGFLLVRLSNPDLWHYAFGGEKPMDFAYFNGVLRSSVFPAVDPWYAGGYINYYYFGFVLAGAPTLLLGVMPQIAYNLIIPTVFALTGIGAFSVAYNVVDALREWNKADADEADAARRVPTESSEDLDADVQLPVRTTSSADVETERALSASATTFTYGDKPHRLANPWLAGIAALILTVLLGNLDTPRTFLGGVAQLGGYEAPPTLLEFLMAEAQTANEPIDFVALEQRAANPSLVDNLRYELSNTGGLLSSIGTGFMRLIGGSPLPLAPHRWYWGPTRLLGETQGGNSIVEMPYFTFLYGDLHAHMMSMPLQFLALGFLLNEVLSARRGNRSRRAAALALLVGAITVGILFATNSWDWITYLLLSIVGLGYAWWLGWRKISRRSLLALVATLGGFYMAQSLASLPFTTWFANAYTGLALWQDDKTPLWAFFSIHGLFLLLLVSLLVWDTGRWFRAARVSSLRGQAPYLIAGAAFVGAALIGAVIATLMGYQVALVVVPLLVWIILLFFREGQSRAMQFLLALAGLALALMLGVEVFVLVGDIGRQNTIFKFYMQVWLLLSIVGGAAFAWLWTSAPRWGGGLRNVWTGLTALLVLIAALYPFMATRGRALDRFSTEVPITLDGFAYMNYATYGEQGEYFALDGDYRMIRWLQENVVGLPVIMEGQSEPNLYKWGSRISINTGLPSVIGWDWHQTQQRALYSMGAFVRQRGSNVNAFYNTTDIAAAWRILDFYDVDYIIVGALERIYYPPASLAKLDQMVGQGLLREVYRDGEDRIYQVVWSDETRVAIGN